MRASWFLWHRRLGAALGLFLFVICSSGSLAVLGEEWDNLFGDAPANASGDVDWAGIEAALREAYPYGEIRIVSTSPDRVVRATVETLRGQWVEVRLARNPARILSVRSLVTVKVFLRQFHKGLLVPKGLYLVTLMSLLLLFSTISGLVIYRRWWTHLFRLRLKAERRLAWADIHRTVGVWSVPFALVIAITGTWYLVEASARDFAGATVEAEPPELARPFTERRAGMDAWVRVAESELPGFAVRTILFGEDAASPVRLDGERDAILVRPRANRVYLDPATGEVVDVWSEEDQTIAQRWSDMADPLHFGDFAGLAVKLLWFLAGLFLSLVVLAGPLLGYLRARRRLEMKRKLPSLSRGRRFLANFANGLVALVLLASIALATMSMSIPTIAGWGTPDRVTHLSDDGEAMLARHDEGDGRCTYRVVGPGIAEHERTVWIDGESHTLSHGELFGPCGDTVQLGEQTLALTPLADLDDEPRRALERPPTPASTYVTLFVIVFFALQLFAVVLWLWYVARPNRRVAEKKG